MCNGLKRLKKIRVAFFLHSCNGWLGGINYYRNLFLAIRNNSDLNIEPVIFVASGADISMFRDYPEKFIFRTKILTKWNWQWFIDKIATKIFNKSILKNRLLKQYKIDVVSHVNVDYKIFIPQIAWIPDFQHKYLPKFFSKKDIMTRNKNFQKLAVKARTVILSSMCAQNDFIKFYPKYMMKAKVLHFAVNITDNDLISESKMREKYNIVGKFFYLPNQYWVHKNHKIVLKALKNLKVKNKDILIISTGNTSDYRNRKNFFELKQYIEDNGLDNNYKILGVIPYSDVQALSKYCLSFINPSFFEGWSTTVEEAKARGKRIILSDIPVHREQNPKYGVWFNPNNADELAQCMWNIWDSKIVIPEKDVYEIKKKNMRLFAKTYRSILEKTLQNQ